MKTPLHQLYPGITCRIQQDIPWKTPRIMLNGVHEPAKQQGSKRDRQVRNNEHAIDQDIFLPFLPGIPPGSTKQ
jgi:hypothetical protein